MKNKTEAFNSSRLTELFSTDYESLIDLLHTAFASLGDLHQGLSKALHAGDRQASLALSHELKGVCSNIGADELAALGGALETELRNSHAVDAAKYLPRLNAAHEQFLLQARAHLDKLSKEV